MLHHRVGQDLECQGLLHPNLHKLYMYHHLAKVDKDIKVAQEDKAGKLA